MLLYGATKLQFIDDVRANVISESIENEVARELHRNSPRNEVLSWENSLRLSSQQSLRQSLAYRGNRFTHPSHVDHE